MPTWTKEVVDLSVAGSSLTIDNIKIDGTTIGHTDDTDLLTLTNGSLAIAGSVTGVTTLATTGAATIGGNLTVTGNSITFGNGEIINNISDGTIQINTGLLTISSGSSVGIHIKPGTNADANIAFFERQVGGVCAWSIGNAGTDSDILKFDTHGSVGGETKMSITQDGDVAIVGDLDIDGTTNLDVVDIDGAVQIDSTLTVGVNDIGYDVKFFGDSDGNYWLYDTSSNRMHQVGTGQSTVKLETTLDSSSVGPAYQTYRNSPSPAASDTLGAYSFHGNDSNGSNNSVQYGRLRGKILDTTAGAEEGSLDFAVLANGTVTNAIVIEGQSTGKTDVEIGSGRFMYDNASNTFTADDTTPSVAAGNFWGTPANSGTTAVTSLDDSLKGQLIIIRCNNTTNATSLSDGTYLKLAGNWTPNAVGETITLICNSDGTCTEISRSDNA
jgi:hypothetical protein